MKNKALWENRKFNYNKHNGHFDINLDHVNPRSIYLNTVIVPAYAALIKKHSKGQLLDLGCGLVPYYQLYADLVTDNICVDWQNSDHENIFVDVFADLNEPIPLPDSSYDTILLTDVLEHIYKPLELMGEVARLLCNKGKVIITVPFFYWLHEPPFDFYRYTEFSLKRFCEESDLSVISLEAYGGYPDVLLDLINKKTVSNIHLAKLFLGFTNLFSRSNWFKKWRERTGKSFPMGYCLVAQKN